ncbi:MAG: hypothetical protein AAGN35_08235 [Bacteroidota bacterium]
MEEFWTELKTGVKELVKLQIVTAVGEVGVKISGLDVNEVTIQPENSAIVTRFNILTGDISTVMDKQFVNGDYVDLREYHATREEKAEQQIRENIKVLRSLIDLVVDIPEREQKAKDNATPSA